MSKSQKKAKKKALALALAAPLQPVVLTRKPKRLVRFEPRRESRVIVLLSRRFDAISALYGSMKQVGAAVPYRVWAVYGAFVVVYGLAVTAISFLGFAVVATHFIRCALVPLGGPESIRTTENVEALINWFTGTTTTAGSEGTPSQDTADQHKQEHSDGDQKVLQKFEVSASLPDSTRR